MPSHLNQMSSYDDQPTSTSTWNKISSKRRQLFKSMLIPSVGFISSIAFDPSYTLNEKNAYAADINMDTEILRKIYDENASTYDARYSESLVSQQLQFTSLRRELLSNACGDVLELGVGTGLNLPHYPADSSLIKSYTAIDLSPNMMDIAKTRFSPLSNSHDDIKVNNDLVSPSIKSLFDQKKVSFNVGDVAQLTSIYRSNVNTEDVAQKRQFDTILDTFGLCVFPDPLQVLREAYSMLEPTNGKLLLLEHQDSLVGKVLTPSRKLSDVSSTCRYNDNVEGLVREAGFTRVQKKNLKGGFLVQIIAKV